LFYTQTSGVEPVCNTSFSLYLGLKTIEKLVLPRKPSTRGQSNPINGNKHILVLVMTDAFSKWTVVVALPNETAETTCRSLMDKIALSLNPWSNGFSISKFSTILNDGESVLSDICSGHEHGYRLILIPEDKLHNV
jgi:hypothetical protein